MALLVLGLILFLGVHSTRIFADGWRSATIARIGPLPWKGIYSVLSIAGFVLLVWGYGQSRQQMPLWDPPAWTRHVTALLMLPVFPLFVAAYVPGNGLKRRLKHPQVLSVKLWALAHLLSNGNAADVILFGSLLVWAVLSFKSARARDRAAAAAIEEEEATRPYVPGQPVRLAGASPSPQPSAQRGEGVKTAVCIGVGLAVYAAFVMGLHASLIGVRPV